MQIFRIFDINNDGTVSQNELKRIVKDLFYMFKKEDNPDKSSQEVMATKAFAGKKICRIWFYAVLRARDCVEPLCINF